jgi:hypothetical protein
LNGKLANLELAVPWEGPTRMILHQTASRWDARPPAPETALVRNILKGIPFTPSEGDSGSWLSIPFNLAGAQLFELHPESYVSSRKVAAPEVVAFENLIETDQLFSVSTLPPPAWWSRNKLGAHFYPMWRHSGDVSFQVEVPATNDGTTDWAGKISMHESIEAHYEAVTPLRKKGQPKHLIILSFI